MASSHKIEPIERFPVTPRADGRFQKRIRGVLHYFGSNNDRKAAIAEYDRVKHDLYAGKRPRLLVDPPSLTIKQLANQFIDEKEAQAGAGDISKGHLADYNHALARLLKYLGGGRLVSDLGPDDFARYGRYLRVQCKLGPYAFNRERACIVAMFNHADECGWIANPMRFGSQFKKASRADMRSIRKLRMLDPASVRKLIKVKDVPMRAMILLGINVGFGATDCATVRWDDLDLKAGRLDTVRDKRKTVRLAVLWPETIAALKALGGDRSGRIFTTCVTGVSKRFADLAEAMKVELADGVAFGALRHTFATIANETQDTDARRLIMGHRLRGMDDIYVELIEWGRLQRVADHVRSRIISSRGNGPSRKKQTWQRAAANA